MQAKFAQISVMLVMQGMLQDIMANSYQCCALAREYAREFGFVNGCTVLSHLMYHLSCYTRNVPVLCHLTSVL